MNSIYIVFTSCNHSHVQVIWGRCLPLGRPV